MLVIRDIFGYKSSCYGSLKRLLKPPPWDKYSKDFSLWFREIKEWEIATKIVAALKNFQDIKLELN